MRDVLQVLKRRKAVFAVPFVIVFLVPTIVSALFMRTYDADALVWVDDNLAASPSGSGEGATPVQRSAETLAQLVQSRAFLLEVIDKTDLRTQVHGDADREAAVRSLQQDLASWSIGRNAVRITYRGSDPKLSAQVVRTTSEVFLAWLRRSADERDQRVIDSYTKQVELYRAQLDASRRELQAFKERNPDTEQLEQRKLVLAPVKVTAAPEVQMTYDRLQKEYEYGSKLYEESLTGLAKARLSADVERERYENGLRVLDPAQVPTSFSKKRLGLTAALALIAAIVIGLGAVLLAEAREMRPEAGGDEGSASTPIAGGA